MARITASAAPEMPFLRSCRFLSDLNTHLAGDSVLTAQLVNEEHLGTIFPPSKRR